MPSNIPTGFNYRVRGFDAERYVDGLPNSSDIGDYTSLVNTERIEVVKGPGLFFQSGLGITGGVINTISKLPTAMPALSGGHHGRRLQPVESLVRHQSAAEPERLRLVSHDRGVRTIARLRRRDRAAALLVQSDADLHQQRYDFAHAFRGALSHRDHQIYIGLPARGRSTDRCSRSGATCSSDRRTYPRACRRATGSPPGSITR